MKVTIEIRTPKGQAKGTVKKMKGIFMIASGAKCDTYISPENDMFYMRLEGTPKQILDVQKRVYMFDNLIKGVFNNRTIKLALKKMAGMTKEQEIELKKLLDNQTKVSIIKEATLEEIQEDSKSFWTKIKERFKKDE